jgi:erythronate-4-phosphate dehydrogenase
MVDLGTAHIAGFSLDGKVCGTAMVLEEMCRFFGIAERWDTRGIFPPLRRLNIPAGMHGQDAVRSIVLQAYDIRRDDADLRATREMPEDLAAERFDRLRIEYPLRCEFSHFIVELAGETSPARTFTALGFAVDAGG